MPYSRATEPLFWIFSSPWKNSTEPGMRPTTCLTCERWAIATAAFLSLLMVLASGCGDRPSIQKTGRVSSARSIPVDGFPPHEHDTIDAPEGVWDARAVRGALKAAGLGPVSDQGLVRLPFLGPDGTRLAIPGAEIQVYAYADAVARARETDLIDSLKVAPADGHVDWRMPASIIVTNNAALIVLTSDDVLRKRIHAAIRLHEMKLIR